MKPQLRMTVFLSLFASSVWAAPTLPAVQVYKSPQCGCCEKWVDHMKSAGFKVIAHDTNTVAEHKTRLGVPLAMGCLLYTSPHGNLGQPARRGA